MQHGQQGVNKNILLSIIVLTSLVNPFLGAAVNVALPNIASEFHLNGISMGWVAMSFLLSSAAFLVPLGKAADIIGRKRIFLAGNIIVTLTSLLCAFSVSGTMLIISRALQGIGSAMMFGTGIAIITSAFPPHERGKAIGINVSAVYLGLSIAPFLGGLLTQTLGWRSIFLFTIPVGLLVIIFTIRAIKTDWREAKHEPFDYRGSLVYIISVVTFMYGFSKLPELYAIFTTLFGLLGLMYFIHIQIKTPFPVLNISLFRHNKVFAFSNLAALINYAATFALTFVLSLYLQYIKALSPKDAGILLTTNPLMMMIVATFSGRLSDKYDSRILSSLGMGIIVVGLILLSFIGESTSQTYLVISLIILGIGFGLFSSPNTNAVMGSVEKKYLGVASATVGTMRLTGQMLSMGIATLIIHIFIGESKIMPANHAQFLHSTRIIFAIFSVLCFLGVFASLARGKRQGQPA